MSQDESQDTEAQAEQSPIPYPLPKLLASTGDTYCCSVSETLGKEKESNTETVPVPKDPKNGQGILDENQNTEDSNYFKGAQWSADGTTIITSSADHHLRAFILPPSLLSPPHPHNITPYTATPSHEPIYAYDIYPHFDLSTTSTTLLLSSVRDHPIRLTNILSPSPFSPSSPSQIVATYPLVSPTTERYTTPHSLLFQPSGTHFVAGSDSLITLFDLSRPGSGPVTRAHTIPSKRKKIKGGGVGMKGIVSALATSPSSGDGGGEILAAGTFTRHISLYDTVAAGGSIATFSVANTAAESAIGGKGVTQVLWSRDGRYLYVIERMSRGVMVYDIRVAGKLVGWLGRREGATMQRLGMSLVRTEQGEELWGGGADGMVRIWRSPHLCGGEGGGEEKEGREAQWVWKAGTDPITSTLVHPTGRVIATCSGQRHDRQGGWDEGFSGEEEEMEPGKSADDHGRGELDNRLKIWAL